MKRFEIDKGFHFPEANVKHMRVLSLPPYSLFLSFFSLELSSLSLSLWYVFSVLPRNQNEKSA